MLYCFGKARPTNLASASRIPGITPAALTSVLLHTKKARLKVLEMFEKKITM